MCGRAISWQKGGNSFQGIIGKTNHLFYRPTRCLEDTFLMSSSSEGSYSNESTFCYKYITTFTNDKAYTVYI